MHLFVTGSSGFVGRFACIQLFRSGFDITAFSRNDLSWPSGIQSISGDLISSVSSNPSIFRGIDCILHMAGRAHIIKETTNDPLSLFRDVNVEQTTSLARLAARAGVRRFIFVSSIKVNGESTPPNNPFAATDYAMPSDFYALSKYEAECSLLEISAKTGMEVVIVRPPLIYGPGVKGNLRSLINILSAQIPLPFASINDNRRSLVSLDNLVSFLRACILSPASNAKIFLVSDQQDVSTACLIRLMGEAIGKPARLFPLPLPVLRQAAYLSNKQSLYCKLCNSLVVDSMESSRILGWKPSYKLADSLRNAFSYSPASMF